MTPCNPDRSTLRPLDYLLEYTPVDTLALRSSRVSFRQLRELQLNVQCVARFASACDLDGVTDPQLRQQSLDAIARVREYTEQLTPVLRKAILLRRVAVATTPLAGKLALACEAYQSLIRAAGELMEVVNPTLTFEFAEIYAVVNAEITT